MTDPGTNPTALADALGAYMSAIIHHGSNKSHCFRLYDHPDDRPKNLQLPEGMDEVERKALDAKKKTLVNLSKLSLRQHMHLSYNDYEEMMKKCGMYKSRGGRFGMTFQLQSSPLRAFLNAHGMQDAEVEQAQPTGSSKQVHYIRLGPKQNGYLDVKSHRFTVTCTSQGCYWSQLSNKLSTRR